VGGPRKSFANAARMTMAGAKGSEVPGHDEFGKPIDPR